MYLCLSSLERCLFGASAHFLTVLFVFLIELYELLVCFGSPCWLHHLQYPPHFHVFVFHFVYSPFAVQKLVSLIRSHCLFLHLFLLSWETDLREHNLWFVSENILPMFSSKVFWWGDFFLHIKRASCLWDYITEICACETEAHIPCCVSIYE